jgi:hypothetical protein
MTEYALKLMSLGRTEAKKTAPAFGDVRFDKVAAFTGLEGQSVLCTSGYLWLTVENEGIDHVVGPGQSFQVTSPGKVILGGKGRYTIEPAPLAKAL